MNEYAGSTNKFFNSRSLLSVSKTILSITLKNIKSLGMPSINEKVHIEKEFIPCSMYESKHGKTIV